MTVGNQAPLSVEFSKQEYWCGLPFHSPGHLFNPGTERGSPALQADSLPSEPPELTLFKSLGNEYTRGQNVLCKSKYTIQFLHFFGTTHRQ